MQKMSWLLLSLVLCSILGCYPDGESMECFAAERYISLNFLTTSQVDSVQFYLGEQRICNENVGRYHKIVVCKSSTTDDASADSGYFSERCMLSEKEKVWTIFHCYVGEPSDGVDVNSGKLSVVVFSETLERVDVSQGSFGGQIINIFPEQDSTEWYGYKDNPIRPFFDDFNSPTISMRKGCFNEFCVASLPMVDKEVCYEK